MNKIERYFLKKFLENGGCFWSKKAMKGYIILAAEKLQYERFEVEDILEKIDIVTENVNEEKAAKIYERYIR